MCSCGVSNLPALKAVRRKCEWSVCFSRGGPPSSPLKRTCDERRGWGEREEGG